MDSWGFIKPVWRLLKHLINLWPWKIWRGKIFLKLLPRFRLHSRFIINCWDNCWYRFSKLINWNKTSVANCRWQAAEIGHFSLLGFKSPNCDIGIISDTTIITRILQQPHIYHGGTIFQILYPITRPTMWVPLIVCGYTRSQNPGQSHNVASSWWDKLFYNKPRDHNDW